MISAVVEHSSHRIAVMYRGEIVEMAKAALSSATRATPIRNCCWPSVPVRPSAPAPPARAAAADPAAPADIELGGLAPCGRCPIVQDRCRREAPALDVRADERRVACHYR